MPLVTATAEAGLDGPVPTIPPGAPIVVMVHGYRFSPSRPEHDPFAHIMAAARARPGRRALPWPWHLGFGRGDPAEGLAIAFGWEARGAFWRAHAEAARAGAALAGVIDTLRAALPGRPVNVIAHSLGARVTLRAMRLLPEGAMRRVVLLSPAEHRGAARRAMASPAGRNGGGDLGALAREPRVRRPPADADPPAAAGAGPGAAGASALARPRPVRAADGGGAGGPRLPARAPALAGLPLLVLRAAGHDAAAPGAPARARAHAAGHAARRRAPARPCPGVPASPA